MYFTKLLEIQFTQLHHLYIEFLSCSKNFPKNISLKKNSSYIVLYFLNYKINPHSHILLLSSENRDQKYQTCFAKKLYPKINTTCCKSIKM